MYQSNTSSVAQTLVDIRSLVDNLLLLLSDKEKVVILKRFNLDAGRRHTLEEIGEEFSVTRERIRQIERNALSKMKRNVFNTTLKFLHEFVAQLVAEYGGLISEGNLFLSLQKLLPGEMKVDENRVRLALEIHDELETVGNTIHFHPHIKKRDIADFALKHIAAQLVNQLQKHGDTKNLTRIHKDLEVAMKEMPFDLTAIRSLVEIDKRITLLGDDLVGLLEWRHINPRTLRDKILYILRNEKQPMHFNEIAQRIGDANFDRRTVNLQAVHNELIRHDNFVLIGRGIYALEEWGYEPGTVAEVVENILREKKELDQDEIINFVLEKRKVKKITIVLALKNDKKFVRVGRHRYKLKKA